MVSEYWLAPWWGLLNPVLILVLVEDGLGVIMANIFSMANLGVLILVLVEDGLGELQRSEKMLHQCGLNPCFSGRWSRRQISLL